MSRLTEIGVLVGSDGPGMVGISAIGRVLSFSDGTILAPIVQTALSAVDEYDPLFLTLTSASTFLTGTNISYSGGRGSAVERLLGNWSALTGGFHALYARVEATGVINDTAGGPIAVKGVSSSTTAKTAAAGVYGGQFIARHGAATGVKAANAAPFIGVEGTVTQGDAGQIGTAIGVSAAYHIPAGNDAYDAGAVFRGLQVTCDDQNDGGAPSEQSGICIWNMFGTQDYGINFVKSASGFTSDIKLQNGETISNATDGTIALTGNLGLASGAAINWNSGDVTATHSANTLAFAGASSGYTFDAPVKSTLVAPTTMSDSAAVFGLVTASANWTGNLVGVRGRVTSTATGAIQSATGVHAALRIESTSGPGTGLSCALNAEVKSTTAVVPNAIVYIQSLPGTSANFANTPYLVFSETAAGTGSNILFEVGHSFAGTVPTIGAGKLYNVNTLQIAVNAAAGVRTAKYLLLGDAEGGWNFGTSGTPVTDDTVSRTFISGYFDNGAASGWANGAYFSMAATGTGSYTSLEGDMTVSARATDLTGVECFMGFTGVGGVTGHAAAGQFTLDFSNAALPAPGGGDLSAGLFNVKGEGGSCDLTYARNVACLQLKTEGTFIGGAGSFQTMGYAILINGFTAGILGEILTNAVSTEGTMLDNCYGLKVGLNTTPDGNYSVYYIPLIPLAEWN